MDQFRYIKIHTWIRGLGSHKVIYFVLLPKPRNQVGINHSRSKACVLLPAPPPPNPLYPREKIVTVEGTAVQVRNQGFIALYSTEAPRWVSQQK